MNVIKVVLETWRDIPQEEGKPDPVSSNQYENEHEQDDKDQKHRNLSVSTCFTYVVVCQGRLVYLPKEWHTGEKPREHESNFCAQAAS